MTGIGMRGSEGLVLTGMGGIALVGNTLFRYTDFRPPSPGPSTRAEAESPGVTS